MKRRSFLLAVPAVMIGGCVSVGGSAGPPLPAPVWRVGDRWVYNCSDGFRVQVTWVETHEVVAMDAQGIDVRVTSVGDTLNFTRMERLRSPGVVLSGAVFNPDETRTFSEPMIRYQFPLTPSTSWTQDLRNPDSTNGLMSWISRFVRVGGYEQVSVPAGTFDALTMRVIMTVDENSPFNFPFQCNYLVWWAEKPGAMVRMIKTATYRERGSSFDAITIRAQNTTIELASFTRAGA